MIALLGSVKGLMKHSPVRIDNPVFCLHYKATTALLLVCCLLVTTKQYIGDPIDCIVDGGKEVAKVMDTYCWIQSTFTVPTLKKKNQKNLSFDELIGKHIPHPGVATPQEDDELKYHKYYQWVGFTLFFQAMLFFLPHYLWKMWENGKCKMLVMDLQSPVIPKKTRREQQYLITSYFKTSILQDSYLSHQNCYAVSFFCCEVLSFFNVIGQIFFTHLFLGFEFTMYGFKVIQYASMDQEDRLDPMVFVFPRVTKCTFHKYGASGTVERIDGLCVLPVNILNEKIYVMLWFWFIALAMVTGLALLYRLAVLLSPQMRLQMLMVRARLAPPDDVDAVARKCQIGDWFVLCQIGKNMDSVAFNELISMLARCFEMNTVENGQGATAKADTLKLSNLKMWKDMEI